MLIRLATGLAKVWAVACQVLSLAHVTTALPSGLMLRETALEFLGRKAFVGAFFALAFIAGTTDLLAERFANKVADLLAKLAIALDNGEGDFGWTL